MASSFTPERPVLNFGPRHHTRWAAREFVLWPAWAYRVVAPQVRRRQLNVLQRAVLGLSRAGVISVAAAAEKLSIHTDLAAFIVTELSDLGYLDGDGCPTKHGLRVLEDDTIEAHEMVAGYVFQDPWSGDLWPRFAERLDYCELEFGDNGYPSLALGSKGKPKRHGAFMVFPSAGLTPSTPSASAIVEAVSRHRKGLRFSDADEDGAEDVSNFVASGVHIKRVSFVEEEPQPVYLMTYLYVPENEVEGIDWYACDPFGLGSSVRLRRRVEQVMQEIPPLHNVVNRLVGNTLHDGLEEHRRWFEGLAIQAGLEVDRRLTINIRTHPVYDQILEMEIARQEMQFLGDDCPYSKINVVLREGCKVLEAAFSAMTARHPLGDIWKRVYVNRVNRRTGEQYSVPQQDMRLLEAIYQASIHSVGFTEPAPQSFVRVKPAQVKSVAAWNQHSGLRRLVITIVLSAEWDKSHPLRAIATRYPGLLVDIDQVASLGGEAGHANATKRTVAEAERHVDTVYSLAAALTGLGCEDVLNSMNDVGESNG